MYATLEESDSLAAARAHGLARRQGLAPGHLPLLEEQVCAEAGLWAPDAARRALAQTGGDPSAAVALVRVWAAALPHVDALPVAADRVHIVRRLSAAFPEVPGGQWLGAAPELATRLLEWDDDPADAPPVAGPVRAPDGGRDDGRDAPSRAEVPRVATLLTDVPVRPPDEDGTGVDPARGTLAHPLTRATRLGVMARAETAALVTLASLVLAQRREAVLAEVTSAVVDVQVPHPRTGRPCRVASVPVTEAEAVIDADVDGRPGFAVGWGASMGSADRRVIALALLDGALQAGREDGAALALDEQTVLAATDGAATNGFVEHLRLPHYASFASYLSQARATAPASGTVR